MSEQRAEEQPEAKIIRGKPKFQAERIKADNCLVLVDGKAYAVHVGEWVDLLTVRQIGAMETYCALSILHEVAEQTPRAVVDRLREVREILSEVIQGWNWTDIDGQALPQPYHNPDALRRLTIDEVVWLLEKTAGRWSEGTAVKNA